jgi:hypothetical protein
MLPQPADPVQADTEREPVPVIEIFCGYGESPNGPIHVTPGRELVEREICATRGAVAVAAVNKRSKSLCIAINIIGESLQLYL